MPFVGYGVYRLLSRRMSLDQPAARHGRRHRRVRRIERRGECAAVEFGLQPDLFKAADGTPLYAPFHLAQTIPAMALAHLTVAGLVEFALTFGVISFLQRANLPILKINHPDVPLDGAMPERRASSVGAGRSSVSACSSCSLRSACSHLVGRSARTHPANLDLGKYNLRAVPTGLARWNSFWDRRRARRLRVQER